MTRTAPHFYEGIQGFFWFRTAYDRLLESLPCQRESVFVEVGSYKGCSMAYLAVEAINRHLPVRLHAVDTWQDMWAEEGDELFAQFCHNIAPVERMVTVHRMRSVAAATTFANESVDVVFLDGDHAGDAVRADINAWWPKLRVGGWMAGDDFMMKPVADAVVARFAPDYLLVHGWATIPEPMPWPTWIVKKEAE